MSIKSFGHVQVNILNNNMYLDKELIYMLIHFCTLMYNHSISLMVSIENIKSCFHLNMTTFTKIILLWSYLKLNKIVKISMQLASPTRPSKVSNLI